MTQLTAVVGMLFALNAVISSPDPDWQQDQHERVRINVPYKIKHVHHHHKVPVYIKEKPIVIKEEHHHHHHISKAYGDDQNRDDYHDGKQYQYNDGYRHRKVDERQYASTENETRERQMERRKILAQRLWSSLRNPCGRGSGYNRMCGRLYDSP